MVQEGERLASLALTLSRPPRQSLFSIFFELPLWVTKGRERLLEEQRIREQIVKYLEENVEKYNLLLVKTSLVHMSDHEDRQIAYLDLCQLCTDYHLTNITQRVNGKCGIDLYDFCPKCRKSMFANIFVSDPGYIDLDNTILSFASDRKTYINKSWSYTDKITSRTIVQENFTTAKYVIHHSRLDEHNNPRFLPLVKLEFFQRS